MSHFGKELRKRRLAMFPTLSDAEFVDLVPPGFRPFSLDMLHSIESTESLNEFRNPYKVTTVHLANIAKVLKADFDAMLRFKIEDEKTPNEVLEQLEPDGRGTDEERIVRLINHQQISIGRGAEILGLHRDDFPFEVVDTDCTCPACRGLKNTF